ncbi:6,7-dimethyl-8-ribityllumazine synthase [Saprospiraceae bacterium]|nr:6,7-dimethyl-8-ribityllumazine synthase [Saprospiraceae bacterium]
MSSSKKNLSDHDEVPSGKGFHIHIVVSDWNTDITSKLLSGAKETLLSAGIEESTIEIVHVPGAFELPVAAKSILKAVSTDSVICLGCVIKGDTAHDEYINNAVATGLTQLSIVSGKPIIFGVLTVNDQQQAEDRAGGKHGNKGVEAAITAIKMVTIQKQLGKPKSTIGFS